MSAPRTTNAKAPPTTRSAVSNGSRMLAGVDGRSAAARRYKDLRESFAEGKGGFANLGEADKMLCSQAAGLSLRVETLNAALVRGEPVDEEELVRVTNALVRLTDKLRAIEGAARPEGLADYLAGREAAA